MDDWEEIRAWRRLTRMDLLEARLALSSDEKVKAGPRIRNFIVEHFPDLRHACIGFYWPFKGEIDLRPLVTYLIGLGAEAALPVVVEKRQPLEFRHWKPGIKMGRGIWNIPIPYEQKTVRPTALLVPLLGFDSGRLSIGLWGWIL